MRFPLLASWMDAGTLDALRDDGYKNQSIGDEANPQGVVIAGGDYNKAIDAILADALKEYFDAWEPDDEAPRPSGTWHTAGWKEHTGTLRNGYQEFFWGDDENNPDVAVVIRECYVYGSQDGPQ